MNRADIHTSTHLALMWAILLRPFNALRAAITWLSYEVFRNAMSAFLSSPERLNPNGWSVTIVAFVRCHIFARIG